MNAILVSVDYTDCLRVTLPYNRHHFDKVLVVTSRPADGELLCLCEQNRVGVFTTDAFYRNGAAFNKWLALEEGLDALGRTGWLCVMDADVLWPQSLDVQEVSGCLSFVFPGEAYRQRLHLQPGQLCVPRRRMFPTVPTLPPEESGWREYPLHPNLEFAGYSQIFHADDPALWSEPGDLVPRWYETNWRHAGGADSFFQRRWTPDKKVRPPFEVLHVGEAGKNWCGRATAVDGVYSPEATGRSTQLRKFMASRRIRRGHGVDPYSHEKL